MTLVATLMQGFRADYEGEYDKFENRRSIYGAYDVFKRQTNSMESILTTDAKAKIKQSFGNTVSLPAIDHEDVVIGNTRSCTVSAGENTSALVTLTFATYSFGFKMYPDQHQNNEIGYQQDFNKKLMKRLNSFAAALDNLCISTLETNKNQLWTGVSGVYYPELGDALQVAQADKNDFYNNATAIMNTMDYYGPRFDVVASTSHRPTVRRLINQGNANATNESFQFNDFDYSYTNRLANGVGIESTAYLVNPGTVAIENRNAPSNLNKRRIGDHRVWDEVDVPMVGLRMGSYYTQDCEDASSLHAGTTGLSQSLVEGFEWSTDIAVVTAYNSDPVNRYNPIVKAEISAT